LDTISIQVQDRISRFGAGIIRSYQQATTFVHYMRDVFLAVCSRPVRMREIWFHLEFIGNQSLSIILLTGFFTGAVFGLQLGAIFQIFRAEGLMGAATAKALAREIAPIMTSFLIAGRAGSAMTAEIATMKVNEQIDAMEVMAVDPISYLVAPRAIAIAIMMPLLSGLFVLIGTLGAYITGVLKYGIDQGIFVEKITWFVDAGDLFSGIGKALIFSFLIATIACRFGLQATGGAKGVGLATTNGVVTTFLALLGVDVIITYIEVAL
jgi:phospholipid/cholesterol/gamma-HCH transport system permease protein